MLRFCTDERNCLRGIGYFDRFFLCNFSVPSAAFPAVIARLVAPSLLTKRPAYPITVPPPPRDSIDKLDTPLDRTHSSFPSSPISSKAAASLQEAESTSGPPGFMNAIMTVHNMIINVMNTHYHSHSHPESCIGLVSTVRA